MISHVLAPESTGITLSRGRGTHFDTRIGNQELLEGEEKPQYS